jgi:heme-degrading monooxygenase HmoA
MYATVRTYSGPERFADELAKREDEVRALLEGIPGFRAYYMLRTEDGGAASISVFDDRSGTEESTRQASDWVRENMPDLGVSPPSVSSGEVVIQFAAAGARAGA